MKYCVYIIKNLVNNKIYIGLTSRPTERFKEHIRNAGYSDKKAPIYSAIKKYGSENFTYDLLCTGLYENDAIRLEIGLIKSMDSKNNKIGYNLSNGGFTGNGLFGSSHPMYGRKRPDFAEMNINMWKGVKFSQERRLRISEKSKNLRHTAETKQNQSEIKKNQWANGVYSSPEYRAKIGNKKGNGGKKPIKIICNETKEVFSSLAECQRKTGIASACNISLHLKGVYKQINGHTFSYIK